MTSDGCEEQPEREAEAGQVGRRVMSDASESVCDCDVLRDEQRELRSPEDHCETAQTDRYAVPDVEAGDAKEELNGIPPNVEQRQERR